MQKSDENVIKQSDESNFKRSRPCTDPLQLPNSWEFSRFANRKELVELKTNNCGLRQGCEDISNYELFNEIQSGSYGTVFRVRQKQTGKIFAMKQIKLSDGASFPTTSIRQITILKSFKHQNIIKIQRVVQSQEKPSAYIVMEYVDHELKYFLEQNQFSEDQLRRLMKDLLSAITEMHERKFLHRDLKTANLLYSNEGILKVCDFGLARKASTKEMTQTVATISYRPPELLLGKYCYGTELDIWSIGVIMAEIILRKVPVKGQTEIDMLESIFKLLGSPTQETWPEFRTFKNAIFFQNKKFPVGNLDNLMTNKLSADGIDLLKQLLTLNPSRRISGAKALNHKWFTARICPREDMPQSIPLNQMQRSRKRVKVN